MTSRTITEVTEDLSRWANQTVRVLFAQIDNCGPLRAAVDDIRFAPLGSEPSTR